MNWVRGKGVSYSGRERPAQPTKRIDRIAHAIMRTARNFMCADHTGNWKRMNKFYPEYGGCCGMLESGIKNASHVGALDFIFGARLLGWLGGVRAGSGP